MTATSLVVAGVPEHFNLPWRTAAERGLFADAGLDVTWVAEPAGTGAMTAAVESGDVDAALVLTEGAMAAIGRGRPLLIEGWWVESPLDWGVHVGPHVGIESIDGVTADHRFAISRFGSGSHLMAHVLADEVGVELTESSFVVCGGIDGAVEHLVAGYADVFLWERAMTAPLVRSGTIGRIGVQATPWPCFVAIRRAGAAPDTIAALRTALRLASLEAARLAVSDDLAAIVTDRYGLHADDVAAWLATLRWSVAPTDVAPERIIEIRDRARRTAWFRATSRCRCSSRCGPPTEAAGGTRVQPVLRFHRLTSKAKRLISPTAPRSTQTSESPATPSTTITMLANNARMPNERSRHSDGEPEPFTSVSTIRATSTTWVVTADLVQHTRRVLPGRAVAPLARRPAGPPTRRTDTSRCEVSCR